jgi:hypothetical protein
MPPIGYRRVVGKTIRFVGKGLFYIVGLIGFIGALVIVNEKAGFWGFVVAFAVAPVTFVAAPWYALVAWGNPTLLVLNYGGIALSFFLQWLGEKISPPELWER